MPRCDRRYDHSNDPSGLARSAGSVIEPLASFHQLRAQVRRHLDAARERVGQLDLVEGGRVDSVRHLQGGAGGGTACTAHLGHSGAAGCRIERRGSPSRNSSWTATCRTTQRRSGRWRRDCPRSRSRRSAARVSQRAPAGRVPRLRPPAGSRWPARRPSGRLATSCEDRRVQPRSIPPGSARSVSRRAPAVRWPRCEARWLRVWRREQRGARTRSARAPGRPRPPSARRRRRPPR